MPGARLAAREGGGTPHARHTAGEARSSAALLHGGSTRLRDAHHPQDIGAENLFHLSQRLLHDGPHAAQTCRGAAAGGWALLPAH